MWFDLTNNFNSVVFKRSALYNLQCKTLTQQSDFVFSCTVDFSLIESSVKPNLTLQCFIKIIVYVVTGWLHAADQRLNQPGRRVGL